MKGKWRKKISSVLALLMAVSLVCQTSLPVFAEEGIQAEVFSDGGETEPAAETLDAEPVPDAGTEAQTSAPETAETEGQTATSSDASDAEADSEDDAELVEDLGTEPTTDASSEEEEIIIESAEEVAEPVDVNSASPSDAQESVITDWQWNDPEGYLTLDQTTGAYALAIGGADTENPENNPTLDDIMEILPVSITATVDGAEETQEIELSGWTCADYPESGIPGGSYTFTAALPDGYALADSVAALTVTVSFGETMLTADTVTAVDLPQEKSGIVTESDYPALDAYTDGLVQYYFYNGCLYKVDWNEDNLESSNISKICLSYYGSKLVIILVNSSGTILDFDVESTVDDLPTAKDSSLNMNGGNLFVNSNYCKYDSTKSELVGTITCLGGDVSAVWNNSLDTPTVTVTYSAMDGDTTVSYSVTAEGTQSVVASTEGDCKTKSTTTYAYTATVKGVTYKDPKQKTVEGDYGAHSMSYAASGETVTATCSLCGETASVQITASDAAYTGYEQKTAKLSFTNWGLKGLESVSTGNIVYSNNVEAGTATAAITVGGETASTTFTIDAEGTTGESISGEGWKFYTETGLLIITSNVGSNADYSRNGWRYYAENNYSTQFGWSNTSVTGVKKVIIADEVTQLGAYCLEECTNLETVTIADSVTYMGERSIRNCTNLKSIVYEGTKSQWDSISYYTTDTTDTNYPFKNTSVTHPVWTLTDDTVSLDSDVYYSQEGGVSPVVNYTYNNGTAEAITENTDYTVSYTPDNTTIGEVTVTITGTGDYFTGTVTKTFTIAECTHTGTAHYEYDETQHWSVCDTCGGTIGDKENHNTDGEGGACSVCGYSAPTGSGTAEDPYLIDSVSDLQWFADLVNGNLTSTEQNTAAYAKLTADIDLSGVEWAPIAPTGTFSSTTTTPTDVSYSGTFDGDGHTISNIAIRTNSAELTSGLFGAVSGTIKNLGIVSASFDNGGDYDGRFGALCGLLVSDGVIQNCYVVDSTVSASSRIAGAIAGANYGGTIENCFSYGCTITAYSRHGDLVGDNKNDGSGSTLLTGTVKNCYSDGTVVGTYSGTTESIESSVSTTDFASGRIAYLLNGSSSENVTWCQTIGTDSYPNFTGGTVYYGYSGTTITCKEKDASYSNSNDLVSSYDTVTHENCAYQYSETQHWKVCSDCGETVEEAAAHDTGGADGACSVCGYSIPTGSGTESDPYLIDSVADLQWFAEKVNGGSTAICGKLTADITDYSGDAISNVSESSAYTGTFDGDGHSITATISDIALFKYVGAGAVIENLTVKGTIDASSNKFAGGIAGIVNGSSSSYAKIENCISEAAITSDVSGDGSSGGLVGWIQYASITNCAFTGSFTGSGVTNSGGLVGCCGTGFTLANSYLYATVALSSSSSNGNYILVRQNSTATITNCYYCLKDGSNSFQNSDQGTSVDAADVASGKLTYLLNGSSSENVTWYQTIDTDSCPNFTGGTVYPTYSCADSTTITAYNNTEAATAAHTDTDPADGKCDVCGTLLHAPHTDEGAPTFTAWTATDSLPANAGSYYLTADVTLSATWTVSAEISLCLNGHSITQTGSASVITVSSGATLNLYDCAATQGKITGGSTSSGGGVYVNGTFNMYGGSITENNATYYGGGVIIDNSGAFNLYGGSISANSAKYGGGVSVYSGTFTMEDGNITGNTASTYGSGVYAISANQIFAFFGGTVNDAVYIYSSAIIYVGSTIDGELTVGTSAYAYYPITVKNATVQSNDTSTDFVGDYHDTDWGRKGREIEAEASTLTGYTFSSWTVTDASGTALSLGNNNKDGTKVYFTMPDSAVTVTANYEPTDNCAVLGHSLTLSGDIGVNFYIALTSTIKSSTTAYVEFTVDGETSKVMVSDAVTAGKTYTNDNGVIGYRFQCFVTSTQMAQTITAKLYDGENSEALLTDSYAVNKYSYDTSNTTLATMVEAMLNYGAYAQKYFGDTGTLAKTPTALDSLSANTLSDYAVKPKTNPEGGADIRCYGISLVLDSETSIYYYIKANSLDGYTIYVDGAVQTPETKSPLDDNLQPLDSMYYVKVPDISADELDATHTLKITDSTGATVVEIGYSAYSYIYSKLNNSATSTDMQNLVTALYYYGEATKAYK